MKITIKDREYKLKYTLRAMIIFEKITNRTFSVTSFTDQMVLFYSLILANNSEVGITFDDLINECDEHPSIMQEYSEFMQNQNAKEELLNHGEEDTKKKE